MAMDPRWKKLKDEGRLEDPEMVIDIEAVIDDSCPPPWAKEDALLRMERKIDRLLQGDETPLAEPFPGPAHWRIVTLGAGWLVNGSLRKLGVVGKGESEEGILRAFVEIFEERSPRIIGWNTRGFDLPVIAHRCMRYGISWPWYYSDVRGKSPRYRYSGECSLDLMDMLSDHGSSRKQTMDSIARLVGLPGKLDTSGSDVAKLFAEGKREEIDRYCLQDVAQTTAVYLRYELLRGKLTPDSYRAAIAGWKAVVEATPGACDVIAMADMRRVMLEG